MADEPEHGTRSAYVTGCRCVPCKRANSDYFREYRLRQQGISSEAEVIHGILPTYRDFSCRCEPCRCAGRVYRARREAMFRAGLLPNVPHGRHSTYSTYRCRCEECSEAERLYRFTLKMRHRVAKKLGRLAS